MEKENERLDLLDCKSFFITITERQGGMAVPTSHGNMGHIPGKGYALFATESEYVDYYLDVVVR